MNHISMDDLHGLLGSLDQTDLILDVRTPEEFSEGHIAGSRNIPYDEVAQHASELKKFKKVYIHCHLGRRAQVAANVLAQLGAENLICISYTGMGDWLQAGYPVVTGKN